MLLPLVSTVLLAAQLAVASVASLAKRASASQPETSDNVNSDVQLPPLLTKDTFDQVLSNGLHVVEFYSPYCVHCKHLAPVWREVYRDYAKEAAKLGIDMLQVDCVEQGDLCDRESVKFYPNVRVYGPNQNRNGGQLLGSYPDNIKKTAESIKAFLRDSAYQFGDAEKMNLPSKSALLNTGDLTEILAGKRAQPYLISFWPSSDKRFLDINDPKDVFDNCVNCREFIPLWNVLSNQLSEDEQNESSAKEDKAGLAIGHVNCDTNAVVCQELGFKELLEGARVNGRSPRIAAVLPRSTGNLIKYTGGVLLQDVVSWAKRLVQNYKVESVTPYDLSQKMKLVNRLVNEPQDNLPGEKDNKVSFVYLYGNSVSEDFDVLPYLLDPIMKLPDVYLYKSNNTGFHKLIERQTKNMLRYIHYNESEPVKEFNQELFVANTITSLPTLVAFKDDSLVPYVFQNFDPKDIRNPKLVESFIRRNSLPFLSELTPATFKRIFNLKNNNIDKVVVAFFDTRDPGHAREALNKLSLAAHDYHYHWSEYLFRNLQKKRGAKGEKVEKLKAKHADSVEITHAMASEITYDTAGQTVFTYLDLNKFRNLITEKGWNINNHDTFAKGDAIVIERTGKFYYETDIYGATLRNEPWVLRNTLMSFHDDSYLVKPLRKNLINSPYGTYLRPMDYIHRHGAKGYLFVVALVVGLYVVFKKYTVGRRNGFGFAGALKYSRLGGSVSEKKGLGILGNIPSSGDDSRGSNDGSVGKND